MARDQILEYAIHLTDKGQVDAYNAQLAAGTGPGQLLRYTSASGEVKFGVYRAPRTGAAIEFSAPFQLDSEPFSPPCCRGGWFTDGQNFPTDVATFTRKIGGWFGIPFLFPTTVRFYWVGRFEYSPVSEQQDPDNPDPAAPPVPAPVLARRRWIDGWELPPDGEGGSTPANSPHITRDSSRTSDGYGAAYRGLSDPLGVHTVMEARGGGASDQRTDDERAYLRVRRRPTTGTARVWAARCTTGISPNNSGLRLYLTTAGTLQLYSVDATNVETLQGTSAGVPLRTWTRLDISFQIATSECLQCAPAFFQLEGGGLTVSPCGSGIACGTLGGLWDTILATVRLNGTTAIQMAGAAPLDFQVLNTTGQREYHYDSIMGGTASDAEFDLDDWIGADGPLGGPGGSHVQLIRPTGPAPDFLNWTGDWRLALQRPIEGVSTAQRLESLIPGALLALDTDIDQIVRTSGMVGIAALSLGCYSQQAGFTSSGSLGAHLLGTDAEGLPVDVIVSQTIVQTTSPSWAAVLHAPSGLTSPGLRLTSLTIQHTKGASANLGSVYSLHATAETLGLFGPEDWPGTVPPRDTSPHNSAYPRSVWQGGGVPVFGAIAEIGGIYTGNGAGLDLIFPLPVQWLWIRRVSGAGDVGARWWTSLLTSHLSVNESLQPYLVPQALMDPAFSPAAAVDDQEVQVLVRIAGSDPQVNALGAVYQYIAICDPAARFVRGGAVYHNPTTPLFPLTDPLADPLFTPLAGFLWPENRTTTATVRLAYKGPGHAAGAATTMAGVALSSYANFGAGALESYANLFAASNSPQTAYTLLRLNDGNGVVPVFQTATYIGDGISPRTIDLLPLSLKRPLFGIVVGPTVGIQRDPSHTGVNSTSIVSGDQTALGIIGGGIDQILVQSALNVLGDTYHVFVLPAGTAACNNGWGCNGIYYPAAPDSIVPPFYDPPVIVDPPPDPDDPGGGGGGNACVVTFPHGADSSGVHT